MKHHFDLLGEPITDFSTKLLYVPKKDELLVVEVKENPAAGLEKIAYERYDYGGNFLSGGIQKCSERITAKYENFGTILPQIMAVIYGGEVSGAICLGNANEWGCKLGINR